MKLSRIILAVNFRFASFSIDEATRHLVPMEVYGPNVLDAAGTLANNLVWVGRSRSLQGAGRIIGNQSDSRSRCEKNGLSCNKQCWLLRCERADHTAPHSLRQNNALVQSRVVKGSAFMSTTGRRIIAAIIILSITVAGFCVAGWTIE
jgi:hypothetical protein